MVTFTPEFDDRIKKRFWSLFTLVRKEPGHNYIQNLNAIEKADAIAWEGKETITDIVYQSKNEINGIYETSGVAVGLTKVLLQELAKKDPVFGILKIHVAPHAKFITLLSFSDVIARPDPEKLPGNRPYPIIYNVVYIAHREDPIRQLLRAEYEAAKKYVGVPQTKQQQKKQQKMITQQQEERRLQIQQLKKNIQRAADAKTRLLKLPDWLNKLREDTKNRGLHLRRFDTSDTLNNIYENIPEGKTLFYLYKSDGVFHPRYYYKKGGIVYADTRQTQVSFPVYVPVLYAYAEGFSDKDKKNFYH
jgi:hypothetical protein